MKHYYIPPSGFSIGSLQIKFYGLIMALSMLAGIFLACKICKKRGVKSDDILLLAIIMLPFSVIGARLYYCFFYEYKYSIKEIFNFTNGGISGLAIYGGVIGGLIGLIVFALIKRNKKLIIDLCDICVPCLILGQAMGRWGNFFNQEAYGNLVTNPSLQWFPYAVFIQAKQAWYQATFFYESFWNIIGLVILLIVYYRSKMPGTTMATYMVWYGLGRVWIEGLRADSLYIAGTSIRVSQALSAVLVVIGIIILIVNFIKKRGKNGQKI